MNLLPININRILSYLHVFLLVLVLFGCSTSKKPAPVIDLQGTTPLSQRVKDSLHGTEYIVKKGETLFSIAWRANIDVNTLAKINKLSPPYQIFPQQKLFLIGKNRQSSKNKPRKATGNKLTEKRVKKPVASTKKQEYGGTRRGEKTTNIDSSDGAEFSKKIKKWQWPADGKIISTFSSAEQGNKGIDIAGRRGDAVKAAADGKVVYAGNALRGYGNLIIIKHNDDYLSAYAHNDKILVKEKQVVKIGQIIGQMGKTDAKTVMLHFEVRFRGKSINPMKYLPKK